MTPQPYRLLVTGATGKQGGALIRALLSSQTTSTPSDQQTQGRTAQQPPIHIVALTRNATSPSSLRLSSHPSKAITLLQGDLSNCNAIFQDASSRYGARPFDGVFSVQVPLKPKVEEAHGKALIVEALKHNVGKFVYTSADRGVDSDNNATKVAHFRSKFNIENFLKAEVARQREVEGEDVMKYTIIRPVAFMENLTDNFFGKAFQSMWELNGMQRKLQLVSSEDVGKVAAEVFLDTMNGAGNSENKWDGKAFNLAGDSLTPEEARAIFRKVVGKEVPTTYLLLAKALKRVLQEQLGDMFDFFKEEGFGADVQACQERFPEMMNFETWLRERSAWRDMAR